MPAQFTTGSDVSTRISARIPDGPIPELSAPDS